MILIFDTSAGLCNQFYDIINGINFCLKYNIKFTFRYCNFRNDDLLSWYSMPIETLFDLEFLKKYDLYVDYYTIKENLTSFNCHNLNHEFSYAFKNFKSDNILEQLIELNKDYVVLLCFHGLYKFRCFVDHKICDYIYPCKDIMERYIEIKNKIIGDEPYNFIHYRYEHDFTKFFNVTVEPLEDLIERIVFKNNLKLFIAASNIKNLLDFNDPKYKNIICKDDVILADLNFEQMAFIDYMFGLNSEECYGNRKSSFSVMVNCRKQTSNYYA
jgi:hypothetical protein